MARSTPTFDKAFAETLCDIQVPKYIKISPNGEKVVYSTSLVGGHRKGKNHTSTLWLASTDKPNSSRKLTSGSFDDASPAWNPMGDSIAFLSDRAKPGESTAIWLMRLDGGDSEALTKEDNEQDIDAFAFSPDGRKIAYVSADEKEKDNDDETEPEVWSERWDYARLRLLDVETRQSTVLVGGDRHVGEIAWSPDGTSLAFMSTENPHIEEAMLTGTSISTITIKTGEVKHLCTISNEPYDLIWSPDGQIYFITGTPPDKDSGGRAVYTIDPMAASPDFTKVGCGEDDDAGDLRVAGDKILINRQVRLVDVISELGGKDLFAEGKEMWVWDVSINAETGIPTLAASFSDINTPYEVFSVQPGKKAIKLSNHGKPLENQSFGCCTVFTCQSSDNQVELDGVYLTPTSKSNPDGTPKEPLATMVLIHGGPRDRNCNSFDTSCFNWAPYLLTKGYGVLLPQYRGSSGRGERFASYSIGGQGIYDYADIITLTDHAISKGFADPKKLVVGGWSQGGLLAYLCSVRNGMHGLGWRFNAAIAGAGVCDTESLAITADLGSTYEVELAGGDTIWTLSHDDTRNRQGSAIWEVSSAMEFSRREGQPVIPPMLILHGEDDERCPFSQAEGFRRALRFYGLPCEFVKYPDEGHGIKAQRFWLDMLERVGRWCDSYIGERSQTEIAIR
ncbi:peptidase yuxl [Fusarium longipes]|uniref:Dipeptidyl-peptidase V n=1 Tax=Fusarium longipes TaxID=694270 RepID=A0A395T220_9HYPO|nr:peptidase yuxl [Fusarium longipes]